MRPPPKPPAEPSATDAVPRLNRREFQRRIAGAAAALAALPAGALFAADPTPAEKRHYEVMMKLFNDLAGGEPSRLKQMFPAKTRQIAMLAYPGMFPLDFLAPHQLFTGLMQTRVHIVAEELKPISAGPGVAVLPTLTPGQCPDELDVLFVPGGLEGTAKVMQNAKLLDWLRDRAGKARYVTSVCTGSLVLGAAGLLRGRKATTYWAVRDLLSSLGATPVVARTVEDGRFITAGGVTAGLDFGLLIAARLASENYAKALQLYFEYDPAPPFRSGSPETAEPEVTAALREMYADGIATLRRAATGGGANG